MRPKEEVPMIGHQAIGGNVDPGLSVSLRKNLLERGVVRRLLE